MHERVSGCGWIMRNHLTNFSPFHFHKQILAELHWLDSFQKLHWVQLKHDTETIYIWPYLDNNIAFL